MMRAFFLVALVFSIIYTVVAFVYTEKVNSYRTAALYDMIYASDYGSEAYTTYDHSDSSTDAEHEATQTGGMLCAVFLLVFDIVFLLGIIRVQTKTMKVIGIIALSLTTILLLFSFFPIASPGKASFDEVGPVFGTYGAVLLAFNIIGIVHAFKTKS